MAATRRFRKQRAAVSSDGAVAVPDQYEAGAAISAALHQARVNALLGLAAPPLPEAGAEGEQLQALIQRTAELFALSITDVTRKTYARRWLLFEAWCSEKGLPSLPASPEAVMLYLGEAAAGGAALGTVRGWAAAVNRMHLEAGHPPPSEDPAMAMFMRGISRVATPPANRQVAALRIGDLRTVCRHLQALETKPSIVRDRAILALSLAGLTDGAIARLEWGDVAIRPDGASIYIRDNGRGAHARTLDGTRLADPAQCWVDALASWRSVGRGAWGGVHSSQPPAPPGRGTLAEGRVDCPLESAKGIG